MFMIHFRAARREGYGPSRSVYRAALVALATWLSMRLRAEADRP